MVDRRLRPFLNHLAFGVALWGVAMVFTHAPNSWFEFMFGPTLWDWQFFNSAIGYKSFFILIATGLWVGSVSIDLGVNRSVVLILLSVVPLLLLKPWISVWIGALPLLAFATNLIIDRWRRRRTLPTEVIVLLILIMLGPFYLVLPWVLSLTHPDWDGVRVLLYSMTGIRTVLYCYDWQICKKNMSLSSSIIYFLFPAHYLVNPSWVIAPKPSDLVIAEPDWDLASMVKGLVWLLISILIAMTKLDNSLVRGIATCAFILFIAEFLTACYRRFGLQFRFSAVNRPWLATSFSDFWNRFLRHTVQFAKCIFVLPIRRRLRPIISNKLLLYGLSVALGLALMDIPLHYLGVYSWESLGQSPFQPVWWYLILMAMLAYDWIVSTLPKSLQHSPAMRWINRSVILLVVLSTY